MEKLAYNVHKDILPNNNNNNMSLAAEEKGPPSDLESHG